ncbi:MAG: hypothetical protein V7L21_15000 [Nostoc sp.]|uniref:hypothetical protein n=1 Tax=unclassified Nostoc TaxID=2593658 RepID=UPI0025E2D69E|nr:hypothetical protein [Nostoc sp. NMS9]MBN3942388.1 hypothetical protein [Nostoc sp. NMS9]
MVKNTSQIKNQNRLIVLVPYATGQEFYSECTDEVAYLPVYVETKDENLVLMAVAIVTAELLNDFESRTSSILL